MLGIVQCRKILRHNHGGHFSLIPLLLPFWLSEFMLLYSSLTFHILIKSRFSSLSSFEVFVLKTRRAASFKERLLNLLLKDAVIIIGSFE